MRIRFSQLADGPGPGEMVVGILTSEGRKEEVILSKRQGIGGIVDVGSPLMVEADRLLIELPRESIAGRWRIWVPRSETIEPANVQAAE